MKTRTVNSADEIAFGEEFIERSPSIETTEAGEYFKNENQNIIS
jgi:hypothetical protein